MTVDLSKLVAALPREAVEAEVMRRSFRAFARAVWPEVTGLALVDNPIVSRFIDGLQAVADGQSHRLLVALPPGTGKTTTLSIYQAWRLARDPGWRAIRASHAHELAATESRRVRRLVDGSWFQARFGVRLREDENRVDHWATTADGRFFAVGIDGALTGRRAHEAVIDDPLNAPDRFSKATRDALYAWFTEALMTRLDGERAPVIVVQQRLDVDDLIGRLIAAGGWDLIELPAEDEDGTPLAPSILSRAKLDSIRAAIGSGAYQAQFCQRPASDETAIIRRRWWRFHGPPGARVPSGAADFPVEPTPTSADRIVIAADPTFGSLKGDFAAVVAIAAVGGKRYVLDLWRARAGFEDQVAAIARLAVRWPRAAVVVERSANGAAIVETLARHFPGAIARPAQGSKLARWSAIAPQIESGSVSLPAGHALVETAIEELAGGSRNDDLADAIALGLAELGGPLAADPDRLKWLRNWYSGYGDNRPRTPAEVDAKVAEVLATEQRLAALRAPRCTIAVVGEVYDDDPDDDDTEEDPTP